MITDRMTTFAEGKQLSSAALTSEVLDFGAQGDALKEMFVFVKTDTAVSSGSVAVALETSDTQGFTSAQSYNLTPAAVSNPGEDAVLVRNAELPRGLKRYVRLKFTVTGSTYPKVTGYLIDGRQG